MGHFFSFFSALIFASAVHLVVSSMIDPFMFKNELKVFVGGAAYPLFHCMFLHQIINNDICLRVNYPRRQKRFGPACVFGVC